MENCIVRRAIKSVKDDEMLGYELVYRNDSDCYYNSEKADGIDRLIQFLMENMDAVSRKVIFLDITPAILLEDIPSVFDSGRVVLQITDNVLVHPKALTRVAELRGEGYQFAVNGFNFSPKYIRLLEHVSYIRIELGSSDIGKDDQGIENVVKLAKGFGKKCIVAGVDTKELYDKVTKVGADYLVGDYTAEVMVVKEQKLSYMQGNFFQLLVAVSKEEPDMEEMESIISRDAGLAYMLLKLVNSAYFALRRRTNSIRQALMTMGIDRIRQWVYLLRRRSSASEGVDEILRMSLLRAEIAKRVVKVTGVSGLAPTEAHLMGMFSTLPYMVEASMEEILQDVPVRDEIKRALIAQEGKAGVLLNLILSYEKADWGSCVQYAGELGLDIGIVSRIYRDCLNEVSLLWERLTTEFETMDEEDGNPDPDSEKKA